jgi:hypothetical protein
MTTTALPRAAEAAIQYVRRGWAPIPLPHRSKNPNRDGWPHEPWTEERIKREADKFENIGVRLGEMSGNLADIDLDCQEALALATAFLSQTAAVFGRETKPASHWLYITTNVAETRQYRDVDGAMLVELRASGKEVRRPDGTPARRVFQTLFPGSIHPSGEAIRWDSEGEPAVIEPNELRARVAVLAAAALCTRHWAGRDSHARHGVSLPLAGFLMGFLDWTLEEAGDFIEAVAIVAGDEEAQSRRRDAETTAERIERGEELQGRPTLAKVLGQDVVDQLVDFLAPKVQAGTGSGNGPPERPFGSFVSSSEAQAEPEWPPQEPLPETPPVSTLPPKMIPGPLRAWLLDIAERLCVPLEMVAMPAMVLASAVVGRAVAIRPARFDDWAVVANLWGADVARPGWLKSPALKQVLAPVYRLIAQAQAEYEVARAEAEAERDRLEAEIAAVKAAMAKQAKNTGDLADVQATLADLKRELRERVAVERRYMTQDPTVEKLGELLRENPRGLLLCRDELAGWLRTLERPGREGEREFYLEAWAGDQSYTFDRIGRGTIHIPALTLSILGGIQPGKLRRYIEEAHEEGAGADGLLQRFQLLVYPDSLGEWRRVDRWPDSDAKRRAFAVFAALDGLRPAEIGAECDAGDTAEQLALEPGTEKPRNWRDLPFLRFDHDAQALFDQWRDQLECRLRGDELAPYPAFESHLSKYRSLMPALALLLHLIDVADGAPAGPVPLPAARLAAAWCDFLEEHARKVYAAELHPGLDAAAALAAKIESGAVVDGQTVRELYRNQWSGLATTQQVQAALKVLESAHWLRVTTIATEGRPSEVVRLHPDFRRPADG